jgi:hypothetical protein
LTLYYRRQNAKRDAAEAEIGESIHEDEDEKGGGPGQVEVPPNLHDLAPGFRYFT